MVAREKTCVCCRNNVEWADSEALQACFKWKHLITCHAIKSTESLKRDFNHLLWEGDSFSFSCESEFSMTDGKLYRFHISPTNAEGFLPHVWKEREDFVSKWNTFISHRRLTKSGLRHKLPLAPAESEVESLMPNPWNEFSTTRVCSSSGKLNYVLHKSKINLKHELLSWRNN